MRTGIDIGTNSVVIAVVDDDGAPRWTDVEVTGLGKGQGADGTLTPASIERTTAGLTRLWNGAVAHGASIDRARAVATAAARRAPNATELVTAVAATIGVALDIVDGESEAALAFTGAFVGLDGVNGPSDDEVLVIDIGGGSTELAVGKVGTRPRVRWSMPVGAVSLRESELLHDPPRPDELTNAIGAAHDHLDDAIRAHPELLDRPLAVGIAGTIVTTAAVEIGLAAWDEGQLHGFCLTRAAAEDVFRTLATEPLADRRHNPGLPADRADVIVGGLCVLVAIMRRLALDELTVSTRGLAHGVALGITG